MSSRHLQCNLDCLLFQKCPTLSTLTEYPVTKTGLKPVCLPVVRRLCLLFLILDSNWNWIIFHEWEKKSGGCLVSQAAVNILFFSSQNSCVCLFACRRNDLQLFRKLSKVPCCQKTLFIFVSLGWNVTKYQVINWFGSLSLTFFNYKYVMVGNCVVVIDLQHSTRRDY